jgi:hypothetical protein
VFTHRWHSCRETLNLKLETGFQGKARSLVDRCEIPVERLKHFRRSTSTQLLSHSALNHELSTPVPGSCQNGFHHLAMHVSEAVMPALKFEGQSRVIDAEAVHQRGVQVMHVDGVTRDIVAVIIGLAVSHAGLDSAAGHPDGETARMMIAAIIITG